MEVLAVQYDTDKKDKLYKWETWKVKIRSILTLNRNRLNELKSEEPSSNPKHVEEQLAKAKVMSKRATHLEVHVETQVISLILEE